MSGPYMVRIVLAPGSVYYLRSGRTLSAVDGTWYCTIGAARRAARRYVGDGKALGRHHVDIIDDNGERPLEVTP